MTQFEYKKIWEIRKLKLEELNKYYRDLRKYEYEEDLPIRGIELRKKIYKLTKEFLKIDKILNLRTVKVIGDLRTKTERPKMYLCTHIGRYDIESTIEAINESAWFIMADPGETYRNFDGLMLYLFGVSYFDLDENYKFDAHTVNVRQRKILSQGGNEFSFPEQAWHLDPILPVGEINPKAVKRAIETNSIVIPVGIEQYRSKHLKHYYVNIGKNLDFEGATFHDIARISKEIRDNMMLLKWQIFEKYGQDLRKNLKENWEEAYQDFINSIMCDTENGYTIEEINRTKYKSNKEMIDKPGEVFEYMNHLIPSKDNAFLLRRK